jgi:uncharacterized protein YqgC (DUF456 family)
VIPALLVADFTGVVLHWIVGAVFGLLGLLCVVITVIGLPGVWVLLLLAGGVQLMDRWLRPDGSHTFHAWTLVAAVALAIVGEVFEFTAGAAGAKKGGASRRGIAGAMVGGIVGAIAGAPFGLVVGAVVGGVLGSALGAIVMELTLPHQTLQSSLKPASGAAVGRLKGLAGKLAITVLVWIGLTVAAFV